MLLSLYRTTCCCHSCLGDRHPDTLASIDKLAASYASSGRYEDAEAQGGAAGRRAELGDGHVETFGNLNSLASMLAKQERYSEAEALHIEALRSMRKELGDRHGKTLKTLNNLAALYAYQERYEDAEALFKVVDGRRATLGDKDPATLRSVKILVGVYKNLGRGNDAARLIDEVLDGTDETGGDGRQRGSSLGQVNFRTLVIAMPAVLLPFLLLLYRKFIALYEKDT